MASGTVKFFNEAKGFGFIAPDNGGPDVFVHVSALARSGLQALNEGDQVSFEIEMDRRSGKPAAVDIEVTGSGPAPRPSARPFTGSGFSGGGGRSGGGGGPRGQIEGGGSGVVKWFNQAKGFGFIQPSEGGADVFVHVSAVERSGLGSLHDGQVLAYDLERDSRSGKVSAVNLRPID